TRGGMGFGAAYKYAKEHGAAIISPKDHAVGSIKETFEKYTHLKDVLPAMGYYGEQLKDLEETIRRSGAEIVVSGTPVNLKRVITIDTPVLHITYSLKDNGEIERELKEVVL
ncbi:MAG: hypothetical protein QXT05_01970, partial [Candidatus Bilamarchaeaceae archaeon]